MSKQLKPVKAIRMAPKRAMLMRENILMAANYGPEQYQYLEEINEQLANTKDRYVGKALSSVTTDMNASMINKLTKKQNAVQITEIRNANVHQALVIKHDNNYYLFDANHDEETDIDYPWFTSTDYDKFNFIEPLKQRKLSLQASDYIEGGICALFATVLQKIFQSYPWDKAMEIAIKDTPEVIFQTFMRLR